MKQVLVACSAGIATSAVVNNAIEEMVREHNIKVDIRQVGITGVGPYEDTADLLVTTAVTKKECKLPVINARSFLAGIGVEKTKQQVLAELQK